MTAGLATFPTRRIPLVDVRRDGGTQVRESMNAATVEEYAAALREGETFPAVTVFFDGAVYWLADGFHRVLAHEKAGLADVLAEVREGTRRDALLFAVGANAAHGLPRTNADKRRAVEFLLRDEEWAGKSDGQIATKAAVTQQFVWKVRQEFTGNNSCNLPETRTGKDGKQYPTRKAKPAPVEPTPAEAPPGHPTRHPLLDELDAARDRDALDSAFNKVSLAGFAGDEAEEAGRIYRRRMAEFRAQAAATVAAAPAPPPSQPAPVSAPAPSQPKQADLFTDAPVHVSTQAPAPQPEKPAVVAPAPADTVTIPRAEYEAMRAELAAYHAWVAVVEQRSFALAPTIKGAANLERIRLLIELAGSPSENEARNAAALACRMIRDQGVKMLTSDPSILDDINATNRMLIETARKMGVQL